MFLTLILSSLLTFVELNCENLFDTRHDSLKNDVEFLPEGSYHWTPYRYWHKVNHLGQVIMGLGYEEASGDVQLPDLVALCEVENDSVLFDLTKRSVIRTAGYEYVMTHSPDERGIDVALMYQPFSFSLIHSWSIRVKRLPDTRPTRDILYVSGRVITGDTLHVFVVHALVEEEESVNPVLTACRWRASWQKLWIPFMRFKVGQRSLWQETSMIITTLPLWNISISTTLLIYLPEHGVAMGQRPLTGGMENGAVLTRYC